MELQELNNKVSYTKIGCPSVLPLLLPVVLVVVLPLPPPLLLLLVYIPSPLTCLTYIITRLLFLEPLLQLMAF